MRCFVCCCMIQYVYMSYMSHNYNELSSIVQSNWLKAGLVFCSNTQAVAVQHFVFTIVARWRWTIRFLSDIDFYQSLLPSCLFAISIKYSNTFTRRKTTSLCAVNNQWVRSLDVG